MYILGKKIKFYDIYIKKWYTIIKYILLMWGVGEATMNLQNDYSYTMTITIIQRNHNPQNYFWKYFLLYYFWVWKDHCILTVNFLEQ